MSAGIIGLILIVSFISFLVRLLIQAMRRSSRQREETFRLVAEKLGGTITPGTIWRLPTVQFEAFGFSAHIEFYSTGGKHPTYYTRQIFRFPASPPFGLHIYPEGFLATMGKYFGAQDIQINDSVFDAKFMIKGSDPELVRAMLDQPTRDTLFQLRALNMNDHIELSARKRIFRIQKLSWLKAAHELERFALLGKEVFAAYLRAAGNVTVPPEAPPAALEKCAVCEDVIEGSNQTCPRCGANHHPECYQLNDGCGRCQGN